MSACGGTGPLNSATSFRLPLDRVVVGRRVVRVSPDRQWANPRASRGAPRAKLLDTVPSLSRLASLASTFERHRRHVALLERGAEVA